MDSAPDIHALGSRQPIVYRKSARSLRARRTGARYVEAVEQLRPEVALSLTAWNRSRIGPEIDIVDSGCHLQPDDPFWGSPTRMTY